MERRKEMVAVAGADEPRRLSVEVDFFGFLRDVMSRRLGVSGDTVVPVRVLCWGAAAAGRMDEKAIAGPIWGSSPAVTAW